MQARPLLAILVGALVSGALVGAATTAWARDTCPGNARAGGYSYAGHQATHRAHGVRATISLTRAPSVAAGHVAGWVGVGGPGQGANGGDAWIQAGLASMPGREPFLYAEIAREGRASRFILIEQGVPVGLSHEISVLEIAGRADWWRVWVDGWPASEPVRLHDSSGRWAPTATAESWNAGTPACNAFGFRFEGVSVSYGGGGSWRPFVPAHRFLDGSNELRDLPAGPFGLDKHRRARAGQRVVPYAFVAASS